MQMRKLSFYPRLAARSIKSNRQFYLPYLLTVIGTCAAMYILYALYFDPGFDRLGEGTANGQVYTQMFMSIGITLVTLFCFIFLIYTNGFLMKRRQKELGLYSVLGMSKRNIAGIMVYESLYIGLTGIALGLALGILLHKLMTLLLHWLMRMPAAFGFEVQLHAVVNTALFFALMIALTLLFNLVRVGRLKPVELLRGGEVGEKEPRVNWLVVIIGVVSLGIGYGIAVMVTDSMWAIALYFIAVFFVIIGTYCLFTSLSILALKALKKNKRYYYKSKHFITVSGMLYRMKRNGVGLANICIIATMVMVMISGTLSLYAGSDEIVNLNAPTDFISQGRHYFTYTESESTPEEREPINPDALNEKVMSFEIGYGFRSHTFAANINAYYTKWMDKSLYDSSTYTNTNEDGTSYSERYVLNMTGANAKHMGVELDFNYRPTRWLSIDGMFSWGDWRWDGLATGFYYNAEGQMVTGAGGDVVSDMSNAEQYRYKIRMDNVNVGGSAQTTAALGLTVRPMEGLRIGLDWNFAARLFADYDIEASYATPGEEYIVGKPWQVPSYHVFDLNAGYTFDFGKVRATLSGNINNLFNQEYIADAWDGSTWEDVKRVFYGFGRTYSVRLKFNF